MKWVEIKVHFDESQTVSVTDLVANAFFDLGLSGVTIETPWSEPTIDWAPDAPRPSQRFGVIGYLPVDAETGHRCNTLRTVLAKLARENRFRTQMTFCRMDEEDWSSAWKDYYKPIRITPRLVIKPTWREFKASAEEIVIEIDPGMAFGTGTHPTTRLCLQLIEAYLKPGIRMVDVGTGSGILLIAGALLGASQGLGLDNDSVAVEVAAANLTLNGIDPLQFKILQGSWERLGRAPFDMVVANILTEVIVKMIPALPTLLAPQGIFICSGIIQEDRSAVEAALDHARLRRIESRCEETWLAFAACWR